MLWIRSKMTLKPHVLARQLDYGTIMDDLMQESRVCLEEVCNWGMVKKDLSLLLAPSLTLFPGHHEVNSFPLSVLFTLT